MNELYRELITKLKILFMRAEHNGEELAAEHYKKAYQRLELIRERRHLTPIGEKGRDREAYELIVSMLNERYQSNGKEEPIEDIINDIESLCEKFGIKDKEETSTKAKEEGFEKE